MPDRPLATTLSALSRTGLAMRLAAGLATLAACDPSTSEAEAPRGSATDASIVGTPASERVASPPAELVDRAAPLPIDASRAGEEPRPHEGNEAETLRARADALPFARTRAGTLRITDARLRDPALAPALADRLRSGEGSTAERVALADALPRTGGEVGAIVVELLSREAEVPVRVQLVAALRRAAPEAAAHGLELAFADDDARVVREAVIAAARRPDGARFSDAIVGALGSSDAAVRVEAARSVGALGIDARDPLGALLEDPDADVRRAAQRALDRLDRLDAR